MKTKVTFITAAFLLVSLFSTASVLPGIIPSHKEDTIKQIFDIRMNTDELVVLRATVPFSNKRQSFNLKVYSETGTLLFASTFIKKGDALIPFSISEFPNGKYTFNVCKGYKTVYSKKITKGLNSNTEDILVDIKK